MDPINLPVKNRDYVAHAIIDSSRWDNYRPREDDIVISTSYKAGTTWTQNIVANLLFQDGELPGPGMTLSPWLDMRHRPLEPLLAHIEAQTHRRFIKTHLALDGLPFYEQVRYVVVGRDPRDVFMSLLNHHNGYTDEAKAGFTAMAKKVGVPFPIDIGTPREAWKGWMTRGSFEWETDGFPYWSHLHHFQTWWDYRHLPNIFFVHFNHLLATPEAEIRRLADFLDIEINEARLPGILDRISFGTMKRDFNEKINPRSPGMFKGGGETFMFKGTNGRWSDVLTDEDLALYEAAKARAMTPEAAQWLESGDLA